MEENNTTNEGRVPSYDQLMETVKALQYRAMVSEQKLMAVNFTTVRLQYLFKVLDHASYFSPEFVNKCSEEIVELLKVEDNTETEE